MEITSTLLGTQVMYQGHMETIIAIDPHPSTIFPIAITCKGFGEGINLVDSSYIDRMEILPEYSYCTQWSWVSLDRFAELKEYITQSL